MAGLVLTVEITIISLFFAGILGSVFDAPFHRVGSRLVVIFVMLFLYPAYRLSGLQSRADVGLTDAPNRRGLLLSGLKIGIISVSLVYLLGLLLDVYFCDAGTRTPSYLIRKSVQVLIGGILVGVFEEILFRGFLFTLFRKGLGVVAAICIGSFLFSIVHFMRPSNPETLTQWNSGFMLFAHLFDRAGNHFLTEFCALFMMGIVLSILTLWTRSVYVAIGLHTGWVWVMGLFRLFMDNNKSMLWLYGGNEWISNSWSGTILLSAVLIYICITRRRWIAAASPESETALPGIDVLVTEE